MTSAHPVPAVPARPRPSPPAVPAHTVEAWGSEIWRDLHALRRRHRRVPDGWCASPRGHSIAARLPCAADLGPRQQGGLKGRAAHALLLTRRAAVGLCRHPKNDCALPHAQVRAARQDVWPGLCAACAPARPLLVTRLRWLLLCCASRSPLSPSRHTETENFIHSSFVDWT